MSMADPVSNAMECPGIVSAINTMHEAITVMVTGKGLG
jgi:hypothetical protein